MTDVKRKLIDVNVFVINLVEDHPGYDYVSPMMEEGVHGRFQLVILDTIPFRAFWIMTKLWGIPKSPCHRVILDFLEAYSGFEYVGLSRESIIGAFHLSNELGHDVYDCYYLSGALQEGATVIITTDTDFDKLCSAIGIRYENSVPTDILKRFVHFKR